MNSTKQQALLLVILMAFLSIVTVFLLQNSPQDSPSEQPELNNTEDEGLLDVEIEEPKGDGLLAQMVKGWMSLYQDFNSGLEIFRNPDKSE